MSSNSGRVYERLQVGPLCLMFFVDETGHETFADDQYPVFGMGGCAVMSSAANMAMNDAWRAMKAQYFGGDTVPLHASALRNPSPDQLAALSKFFNEQKFARFAVTMSKSIDLPRGMTPVDVAAGALYNRFRDLLSRVVPEPNEVAFLHEASDRCDRLVEKHFGGTVVRIEGTVIPVHKALIPKSAGLAELEVADFVMHAAGRRAAQLHRNPTTLQPPGKDFVAVFHSNPNLNSYMHVTEVGPNAIAVGVNS